MNSKIRISFLLLAIATVALRPGAYAQDKPLKKLLVGAYYFDGWTGKTNHITNSLKENFKEREPVWGWVTSKPEVIKKQIDAAVGANIDFFSFCWYDSDSSKRNLEEPRNNALRLFINTKDKGGLKFNLLVANHFGYLIGPSDWERVTKIWISLFENEAYLKFNGKPLLTFLSLRMLLSKFGSAANIKIALDKLRADARAKGLGGVMIAVCVGPKQADADLAKQCGFDLLTGYNYHDQTLIAGQSVSPIKALSPNEQTVWNSFLKFGMPYMPVTTLNWDPRPWDDTKKVKKPSPHFDGYSAASIYQSVFGLKKWTLENNPSGSANDVAMIYAWNEYGEGAWLTPSAQYQNKFLLAVKEALK
jgi:hypothetical protein